MKINYFFAVLALASAPVYGNDLITVLVENGFVKFAMDLQRYPDLMAQFAHRNDITVWAPIDKAVTLEGHGKDWSKGHGKAPRSLLLRRQTRSQNSGQVSHYGKPPSGRPAKRDSGMAPSNFATLRTFLEDPTFVNLGHDQPGRVVQSYLEPSGSGTAVIQISAGGGNITSQVSGPFKYDQGLIYGVDGYFTLPSPLIDTLTTLKFTTFRDAIISADLEEKLSDTPAMTIFAFADDAVHDDESFDVLEHSITGLLGYSPELVDGGEFTSDAGTSITVKYKDGQVFVNGNLIVKSDITIKNGVVHQLEKPLSKSEPKHSNKSS